MRLISYLIDGQPDWGVRDGDSVISLKSLAPTLDDFIANNPPVLENLRELVARGGLPVHAFSNIDLTAPINKPSKIVAIGLNYRDHCRETGSPEPESPVVFAKFPSTINGPHDPIKWSKSHTSRVDWEVELGVVIGRRAYDVSEDEALDYVLGYTVANDISARDIQGKDGQWVRGKSLDTFCPIGPELVTTNEIPDPQNLAIRAWVNGVEMQSSKTEEMIFNVAFLISYLSRSFTLMPGDLLITGTPYGVGIGRDPQIFLKDGDLVEAEIEGIGRLRNRCEVRP